MPEFEEIYNALLTGYPKEDIKHVAKKCEHFLRYLRHKNDILFLTTSNRYSEHKDDIPKSTQLARSIKKHFKNKRITILDVPRLQIHVCEGNISSKKGNRCGMPEAILKNSKKNPSGNHRCWASINNKDDELWKITKILFQSKIVVFFGSVRWGQANSIYQKLFERLSWIENRATTLGEKPIKEITRCEAGIVLFGQNWNGEQVLKTQMQNFRWFGFKVPKELSFNWQYTSDAEEESKESYTDALNEFREFLQIALPG
jgi:multimeric flavodoxin WrbA